MVDFRARRYLAGKNLALETADVRYSVRCIAANSETWLNLIDSF